MDFFLFLETIRATLSILILNRAKLRRANVHFLSAPIKDGTTGTVIVLTTPDAQRTMLAYQVKFVHLIQQPLYYYCPANFSVLKFKHR